MRLIGLMLVALAGPALAQSPSRSLPTPATPGPNPGAAATDAVTNPTKPTQVAPPETTTRPPASAPPPTAPPSGSGRSSAAPTSGGEMREILETARAIAKSTGESVEYGRVVPDILTQILAKLDKLENKLDKVENALKDGPRARR